MKTTPQKSELLVCFALSSAPTFTAKDVSKIFGIDISVARRRLEVLVKDGELVRVDNEQGYLEVSTGRTMKRKGVAYKLSGAQ